MVLYINTVIYTKIVCLYICIYIKRFITKATFC